MESSSVVVRPRRTTRPAVAQQPAVTVVAPAVVTDRTLHADEGYSPLRVVNVSPIASTRPVANEATPTDARTSPSSWATPDAVRGTPLASRSGEVAGAATSYTGAEQDAPLQPKMHSSDTTTIAPRRQPAAVLDMSALLQDQVEDIPHPQPSQQQLSSSSTTPSTVMDVDLDFRPRRKVVASPTVSSAARHSTAHQHGGATNRSPAPSTPIAAPSHQTPTRSSTVTTAARRTQAQHKTATTPNRQIMTGPRYIQETPRYPSSFAAHRTTSPPPSPTPSLAIARSPSGGRTSQPYPSGHRGATPVNRSRSPSIMGGAYRGTHHDETSAVAASYHNSGRSSHEPLMVIETQYISSGTPRNGGKHHHTSTASSQHGGGGARQSDNRTHPQTGQEGSGGHPLPSTNTSTPIVIYANSPPPPTAAMAPWYIPQYAPTTQAPYHYTAAPPPWYPYQAPPPTHPWYGGGAAAAPVGATHNLTHTLSPSTDVPAPPLTRPSPEVIPVATVTKSAAEVVAAPLTSTITARSRAVAAQRVVERYRYLDPVVLDVPPHVPIALRTYLKPDELDELDLLKKQWAAAAERGSRARQSAENLNRQSVNHTSTELEAQRHRHVAQQESHMRSLDVRWQHHLALLGTSLGSSAQQRGPR